MNSKKKSLIELYKSILKTADMVVSDDGFVSVVAGDTNMPAMVKGKRLVLPTPEHLKNSDWSNRVVFHPLSENILRGESQVLEMFRNVLNIRINTVLGTLAYQLLLIATSTGEHSKLTPDQSEFLSFVKHADEKTIAVLEKLLMQMPTNQHQKSFASIYLKRSGTVNGKRHSRVGVVSFPLYEELKKDKDVYGVKLRKLDREALIKLMEFMIPGIDVSEGHNRGSDSTVAPYLDALMKAVMGIAGPINDIVALFNTRFEDIEAMQFEADWVDAFENLACMVQEINSVPMQAGNEGATNKPAVAPTPGIPAPLPQSPDVPAVKQPGAMPDWLMNNQPPPAAPNQFGGYPQQQNTGWQQPPQQQPGVVKTPGGVDFDSLLRSNPSLGGPVQHGNQGGGGWNTPQQRPAYGMNNNAGWNSPPPPQNNYGGGGNWNRGGGRI